MEKTRWDTVERKSHKSPGHLRERGGGFQGGTGEEHWSEWAIVRATEGDRDTPIRIRILIRTDQQILIEQTNRSQQVHGSFSVNSVTNKGFELLFKDQWWFGQYLV